MRGGTPWSRPPVPPCLRWPPSWRADPGCHAGLGTGAHQAVGAQPDRRAQHPPGRSATSPGGTLAVDSDWVSEHIVAIDGGAYAVPDDVVRALLAEAAAVLAGHPRIEPAWLGIGPKPIPGDGEPVLGRVDAVPGLSVAFTHSGATLGLIAGELIAFEIIHDETHPLLSEFNVRRFG